MSKEKLLESARKIAAHSYSPYSKRKVGSAVRLANDKIYSGANVENASFGATVCAERVAVWKAMSENPGIPVEEIVVYTSAEEPWPPCGMCRQVLAEFASNKLIVHTANDKGIQKTYAFKDLFPESFSPDFLK